MSYEAEVKKVLKGMKKFPTNVQKNIMRGATRAAAKVVQQNAINNAPDLSGTLKKSIVVRGGRSRDKQFTEAVVKITYTERDARKGKEKRVATNNAFYASMVEYGTKDTAAQPFLRPAGEQSKGEVVRVARDYIIKRYSKEAAKIKRG